MRRITRLRGRAAAHLLRLFVFAPAANAARHLRRPLLIVARWTAGAIG
ncbi:Hypothetical protein CAP_8712 [Chondromyces apiculatus DSM 436]|uniref:Uncharacterized protein n=1 Tax=Chondromyces apiculatus DSM 436 TaxID=1192034 RepID=A0A017TEE2_9BACT|nr:Hypothetical protein CAP_8712 [Chondromyces apiculatus DSM 436]